MQKKKKTKLPVIQYATGGEIIYGTNAPTSTFAFSNTSSSPDVQSTGYYATQEDLLKMQKTGYNPSTTIVYHPNPMNPKQVTYDSYVKPEQTEVAMDKLITPSGKTKVKYPFGGYINKGLTNLASNIGINDKAAQLVGSIGATATGLIPGMQDNLFQAGDIVGDAMQYSQDPNVKKAGRVTSALAPLTQFMAMGGELTEFQGNTHEEGGIPLGNGTVEVEKNETKWEDYIFSDRIKLPWNKKSTFAEESKKIERKYKDLSTDPLSMKTKKVEMDKLRDMQETAKQEMVTKAQKLMAKAGMHQMPDGSMMSNSQMAYGGKMYYANGGTHIVDENYGINQFGIIPNQDDNYLGKENWQYENEGSIPNSRLSKNYSPEEQIVMQNLANQFGSGKMTLEDYQQAISEMGTGYMGSVRQEDGSNISYLQNKYPDILGNQGTNPNGNTKAGAIGNAVANSAGTQGGTNPFNNNLTTPEKLVPFLPVLGQAATLIKGVDQTTYKRATPEMVDLKPQRTAAEKQAAIAKLNANRNIRNTAGNSGRGLTNMITSNAAIQSNLSDQLSQSYLSEATTNTGIKNQFNQMNTQIANEEVNANEMNKSKFQEQAIATLYNLANTYTGVNKDQRMYSSQNNYNQIVGNNLNTQNYMISYDANGNPIVQFRPSLNI